MSYEIRLTPLLKVSYPSSQADSLYVCTSVFSPLQLEVECNNRRGIHAVTTFTDFAYFPYSCTNVRTREKIIARSSSTSKQRWHIEAMANLGLLLVVAVATTLSVATEKRQQSGASDITYKQFYVNSLIVSRYAVTTVTSVVRNDANESKELDFRVQLPETAFISNFSM